MDIKAAGQAMQHTVVNALVPGQGNLHDGKVEGQPGLHKGQQDRLNAARITHQKLLKGQQDLLKGLQDLQTGFMVLNSLLFAIAVYLFVC